MPTSHPPVAPSIFMRRVWWADAAVSAAVGAVMALAAEPLAGLLAVSASLVAVAGLALLPYAAFLAWLATRRAVPRLATWAPPAINVVWAIDCGLLLAAQAAPNSWLLVFIAIQIATVLVFAELQLIGLKRAARRIATAT